jgi:branched-chain amino acid transport system substrate-binding protein
MKKTIISAFVALSTLITTVGMSFGDLLVPVMTYRVGPFAANGTMNANGFVDYLTMLNERVRQVTRLKKALSVTNHTEERTPWCIHQTLQG